LIPSIALLLPTIDICNLIVRETLEIHSLDIIVSQFPTYYSIAEFKNTKPPVGIYHPGRLGCGILDMHFDLRSGIAGTIRVRD